MNEIGRVIIIAICLLVVVCCAFALSISIAKKNGIKKMYLDIERILESLVDPSRRDEFSLEKIYSEAFDYIFETPKYLYYIKVIANMGNQEICVNNAVKWQLRKSFNDESIRFVEHVEGLMRMDIESKNKEAKKLYIIYPNARSLLKYINECEMIFIHPETDVYGTNIIPFVALSENPKLVKVDKEI